MRKTRERKMRKSSPAKEYLKQIRAEQIELRVLVEKRAELHLSLYPPAIRYDKAKVQVSPADTLSERMAAICELDDEIMLHVAELDRHRLRTMKITRQIEDPACRMVIELYYLTLKNGKTLMRWEDVARAMNYTEDHILHKVHPRALCEFGRLMKEDSK